MMSRGHGLGLSGSMHSPLQQESVYCGQTEGGRVGFRLPKISLPRLQGNVMKFFSFRQSFERFVHLNGSPLMVNKFNYLLSLLEGLAYKVVKGLELTEENYGNAVQILKARFGGYQQIVSSHMQALL